MSVPLPNGLGATLVCSWLGSMAYAAVGMQAITYFEHFPNDPLRVKALVVSVLLLNTANLVGQLAFVYTGTVNVLLDPTVFPPLWPLALVTFSGPFTMTLVNLFLVYRLYNLSKNWFLAIVLGTLQVLAMAVALFNAGELTQPEPTTPSDVLNITLVVALGLFVLVDTGIAISLLWCLTKLRTPFKETQAMVKRLMRMIIQSGTATTVISVTILIVFLSFPPFSMASTAISFLLSHFYSLTLFFNLNVRDQIRKDRKDGASGSRNYMDSRGMDSRGRGLGEIQFRGYSTSNSHD